ncbi:hypothetical protein HC752_23425 [Vibrio sp. S9_S30]|uniref:hypothetical protein n=1 Tax=Vibrio sp. S9_S30 TaxID=2720226 RepID=UPI00168094E1|nr:hypothetical protein [Vibrio sp. S9_S30]MBD1559884.1 hypothetical protein [Vibrio sp. S9_S30]
MDGEASRAYEYQYYHPTMIRVEPAILEFEIGIFGRSDMESLSEIIKGSLSGFKIELERGQLVAHILLEEMGIENLIDSDGWDRSLKRVLRRKADLYVAPAFEGFTPWNEHLTYRHAIKKVGTLHRAKAFLYLHEKHGDLAFKFARVLKEMKVDGTLDELTRNAVVRLSAQ